MATQLSRKRRARDNKLTELLWEPDDSYTLTPTDIANGWFEHTLVHPRIVYRLLVRCKVNAGEYAHTSMIVNEDTGLVHVTLGGWETVDETVRFQYYYRHGGRLVPADPAPFEIVVNQKSGGQNTGAPHDSFTTWEPVLTYGGTTTQDYAWYGDISDPDLTGFKIVGEFSGNGQIQWDFYINNPGSAPFWPEPDNSGFSQFIGLNNSGFPWTVTGAHQTFEYEFAMAGTSGDPAYGGFDYSTPLSDLLVSLNALEPGVPNQWYDVAGGVDLVSGAGSAVTIHKLDLVLTGVHPA